jgi:trehalose 6-phosphate synthase
MAHFTRYVRNEGGAERWTKARARVRATVVAQSFPIGIDVDEFTRLTHAPDAVETYENMRDEYSRRRSLLGIDRLDYSKGIRRARAFRELLTATPKTGAARR